MAFAYVQQAEGTASSAGAATTGTGGTGFGSNVTAGNYLLVAAAGDNNFTPSGVTISSTGTATLGTPVSIGGNTDGASSGKQDNLFLVPITGSGTCVVIATAAAFLSGNSGILVAECSGLDPTTPFVSGEEAFSLFVGTGSASADSLSSGLTPTLSAANGILFGFNWCPNNNAATAGTGFTSEPAVWSAFGSASARFEYKQLAATTAVAGTFTPASFIQAFASAVVLYPASGGGGSTGTAAITEGADTVSASGATTIVGTAAIIEGSDAVAGTGKTTIVGTAAITEGADTVAGTGKTTIVGTAAITEGADTVAGTGVTTIVGTAAITEGADTVTASGSTGLNGTAAITEGSDTVSASGTTTIVGSAGAAEGADTVAGSGTTTVVATAAITEGADTVAASGVVGSVTGTASILEDFDSVAAAGSSGQIVLPAVVADNAGGGGFIRKRKVVRPEDRAPEEGYEVAPGATSAVNDPTAGHMSAQFMGRKLPPLNLPSLKSPRNTASPAGAKAQKTAAALDYSVPHRKAIEALLRELL